MRTVLPERNPIWIRCLSYGGPAYLSNESLTATVCQSRSLKLKICGQKHRRIVGSRVRFQPAGVLGALNLDQMDQSTQPKPKRVRCDPGHWTQCRSQCRICSVTGINHVPPLLEEDWQSIPLGPGNSQDLAIRKYKQKLVSDYWKVVSTMISHGCQDKDTQRISYLRMINGPSPCLRGLELALNKDLFPRCLPSLGTPHDWSFLEMACFKRCELSVANVDRWYYMVIKKEMPTSLAALVKFGWVPMAAAMVDLRHPPYVDWPRLATHTAPRWTPEFCRPICPAKKPTRDDLHIRHTTNSWLSPDKLKVALGPDCDTSPHPVGGAFRSGFPHWYAPWTLEGCPWPS